MEPHAQLQQRRHAPVHLHMPLGGCAGTGHHFQQRALACAIASDDAQRLALRHPQAQAAQHPQQFVAPAGRPQPFGQPAPARRVALVGLAQVENFNGRRSAIGIASDSNGNSDITSTSTSTSTSRSAQGKRGGAHSSSAISGARSWYTRQPPSSSSVPATAMPPNASQAVRPGSWAYTKTCW